MSNQLTDQERIWQVVSMIPPGRVATYGQIAHLAELPRGARLVGWTLSKLPEDTRLPWHRVINASGRISLPRHSPAYRSQKERLQEESVTFLNGRISLSKYQWQGGSD